MVIIGVLVSVVLCGFRCGVHPLGRLWVWLWVIVADSFGYRSWGLLGEMRHWVDCRVASTVVEWMIEGLDSCEWVDQGGGVFC